MHLCCNIMKMFTAGIFYMMARCLIYALAKCLIWSNWKSQALRSVVWQIIWSVFGKMFNASLLQHKEDVYFRNNNMMARCLINILAKCLIWSNWKSQALGSVVWQISLLVFGKKFNASLLQHKEDVYCRNIIYDAKMFDQCIGKMFNMK